VLPVANASARASLHCIQHRNAPPLLLLLLPLPPLLFLLQILAEALQVIRRCREGQPIQQLWGAAAAAAPAAAGEERAPLAQQQQ
jgi:hypothetical protein